MHEQSLINRCVDGLVRQLDEAAVPVEVSPLGRHGVQITLARPEKRNAISIAMAEALTATFDVISRSADIRLVAIGGKGDVFCAGVDLWDHGSADPRENIMAMARLFRAIATLPQHSVALVSGPAYGAGLGIVAACSGAVATSCSRFGTPEVRSGLIPSVISPYILRAIGPRAAVQLFVTGLPMDAHRALALGLVDRVVSSREDLREEASALAEAISNNAPAASRKAKRLSEFTGVQIDEALMERTVDRTLECMRSPEVKAGFLAIRTKVPPPWAR